MVFKMRKKGIILFLFLVSISLLAIIGVSSLILPNEDNNNEFIEPQPPVISFPSNSYVNVTDDEWTKAVNVAVNDAEVKEWLGKGYEICSVVLCTHGAIGTYYVGILTQEQKLPWIIGISLIVNVNETIEEVNYFSHEFAFAPLSEEQEEEVLNIATAYVEENHGTDYAITYFGVKEYKETIEGKTTFYAYPRVIFRVPSNTSHGISVHLGVDLKKGEVVEVKTYSEEWVDRDPRFPPVGPPDFSNQNVKVGQGESARINMTLSLWNYEEDLTLSFSLELDGYQNMPVASDDPSPFKTIFDPDPLVLTCLEPKTVTITITADDDAPLGRYLTTIYCRDPEVEMGMGANLWITVVE
jgi:hypothetical protein